MRKDFASRDFDLGLADEVAAAAGGPTESGGSPDLGDLVIVLLASTLAGLRDRLEMDGFDEASKFVAGLTERCDSFLTEVK
jgi:hypothetical protein